MPTKLFVGGLAWATTDDSLRKAFESFGEVLSARVILDRETGRSRGFGFVSYAEESEAQAAQAAMHGADVDGRSIRVDIATDGPRRNDGPRRPSGPGGPPRPGGRAGFGGGRPYGGGGGSYGGGGGGSYGEGYSPRPARPAVSGPPPWERPEGEASRPARKRREKRKRKERRRDQEVGESARKRYRPTDGDGWWED